VGALSAFRVVGHSLKKFCLYLCHSWQEASFVLEAAQMIIGQDALQLLVIVYLRPFFVD
jgi:hypothetical protein